jgi:hypothetical protein
MLLSNVSRSLKMLLKGVILDNPEKEKYYCEVK